jgi:hypothetical protein
VRRRLFSPSVQRWCAHCITPSQQRAAWLTKQDDGSWLDVILWSSREAAEKAAQRINELPEARSWFRHIAESQGLRHAEVVHEQRLRFNPSRTADAANDDPS